MTAGITGRRCRLRLWPAGRPHACASLLRLASLMLIAVRSRCRLLPSFPSLLFASPIPLLFLSSPLSSHPLFLLRSFSCPSLPSLAHPPFPSLSSSLSEQRADLSPYQGQIYSAASAAGRRPRLPDPTATWLWTDLLLANGSRASGTGQQAAVAAFFPAAPRTTVSSSSPCQPLRTIDGKHGPCGSVRRRPDRSAFSLLSLHILLPYCGRMPHPNRSRSHRSNTAPRSSRPVSLGRAEGRLGYLIRGPAPT